MSEAHEIMEGKNKKIALMIAVLAALLAICEMGAKSSQTRVLTAHVEATNQWGFFQAKTFGQTVLRTAADWLDAEYKDREMPPGLKARVARWHANVERYESEPETGEGRKQLSEKAIAYAAEREVARSAYHMFEFGAAAFQLAIVLASAASLTGAMWLAAIAGLLGFGGATLTLLGYVAPTLIHL